MAGDAAFDATAAVAAAFVRRNAAAAAGAAAAPPFLAAVGGLLGVCAGASRLAPALTRRVVGLGDDVDADAEQGDAEDDGDVLDDGEEGDLSSPPIAAPTFMTALNSSNSSQPNEGSRRRRGAAAGVQATVLAAAEALGLLLPVRARRPGTGVQAASREGAAPPASGPPLSPAAAAPLACIYACAAFLRASHDLLSGSFDDGVRDGYGDALSRHPCNFLAAAAPALDAAATGHAAWAAGAVRVSAADPLPVISSHNATVPPFCGAGGGCTGGTAPCRYEPACYACLQRDSRCCLLRVRGGRRALQRSGCSGVCSSD